MDGVARVVITHEVHRQFRWLVILELTLCFVGCLILLPCFAIAAFLGGGNLDFLDVDFRGRTHDWWQELVVRVLDGRGNAVAEVRSRPADADASRGIVAAVLQAAKAQGLVVVEAIRPHGTQAVETRHVWYGGRPLFASPAMRSEEAAAQVLTQHGLRIESREDALEVSYDGVRPGRLVAWLLLIFLGCTLGPFLLIVASGRRLLGDLLADAQGAAPPRTVFTVRAESLTVHTERRGEVRDRTVYDGADLLGVVFGPALSWSKHEMRRIDPRLSVVSRAGEVDLAIRPELGPAFRDLVVAATVRLREARPELGLLGDGPAPTRCPFCGQRYVLEPGARCPSCGAPGILQ